MRTIPANSGRSQPGSCGLPDGRGLPVCRTYQSWLEDKGKTVCCLSLGWPGRFGSCSRQRKVPCPQLTFSMSYLWPYFPRRRSTKRFTGRSPKIPSRCNSAVDGQNSSGALCGIPRSRASKHMASDSCSLRRSSGWFWHLLIAAFSQRKTATLCAHRNGPQPYGALKRQLARDGRVADGWSYFCFDGSRGIFLYCVC